MFLTVGNSVPDLKSVNLSLNQSMKLQAEQLNDLGVNHVAQYYTAVSRPRASAGAAVTSAAPQPEAPTGAHAGTQSPQPRPPPVTRIGVRTGHNFATEKPESRAVPSKEQPSAILPSCEHRVQHPLSVPAQLEAAPLGVGLKVSASSAKRLPQRAADSAHNQAVLGSDSDGGPRERLGSTGRPVRTEHS